MIEEVRSGTTRSAATKTVDCDGIGFGVRLKNDVLTRNECEGLLVILNGSQSCLTRHRDELERLAKTTTAVIEDRCATDRLDLGQVYGEVLALLVYLQRILNGENGRLAGISLVSLLAFLPSLTLRAWCAYSPISSCQARNALRASLASFSTFALLASFALRAW